MPPGGGIENIRQYKVVTPCENNFLGVSKLGVFKLALHRRPEVAGRDLLEGKVEPGAHHPGSEDHDTSDNDNDNSHESHHEVHIFLVLILFSLPLQLGRSGFTGDLAVGGIGGLRREDGLDKLLNLSADNADLQEVGILGGILLVDLARVLAEGVA